MGFNRLTICRCDRCKKEETFGGGDLKEVRESNWWGAYIYRYGNGEEAALTEVTFAMCPECVDWLLNEVTAKVVPADEF